MNIYKMQLVNILQSIIGYKNFTAKQLIDDDYFQNNMLDSIEIQKLLIELENHFGIKIDNDYLVLHNWQHMDAILSMLEQIGAKVEYE